MNLSPRDMPTADLAIAVVDLAGINAAGRWTPARKEAVIRLVDAGVIALPDALARYQISLDEFLSWKRLIAARGREGLKATRLQEVRHG